MKRGVLTRMALALLVFGCVVLLGFGGAAPISIRLLAGYALKGTQIPVLNITDDDAVRRQASRFIDEVLGRAPLPMTVVDYPASLWPISQRLLFDPTFDRSVTRGVAELQRLVENDSQPVIFGYSQGAIVATEYKKGFNARHANAAPEAEIPRPVWVLVGNPSRPNGGVTQRVVGLYVPVLEMTARGATPTHTAGSAGGVTTYDVSGQYDPFSDFPRYPANLVSLANAVLGALYVHTDYTDLSGAILQEIRGDTAYYLRPSRRLPLLMPLAPLGVPDPVLAALDAPLRVIVEAGYDRTIGPGEPTTMKVFPRRSLAQLTGDVLRAIPTGLDDAAQEVTGRRPFGTAPAGPFGVGGPPVGSPDPDSGDAATEDVDIDEPAEDVDLDEPTEEDEAHVGERHSGEGTSLTSDGRAATSNIPPANNTVATTGSLPPGANPSADSSESASAHAAVPA